MKWVRNVLKESLKDLKKLDTWKKSYVIGDPKEIPPMMTVDILKRQNIVGIYEAVIGEDLED